VNISEAIKELERIRAVVGDDVQVWIQDSSYNEKPLDSIKTADIPFERKDRPGADERRVVIMVGGNPWQDGHRCIQI